MFVPTLLPLWLTVNGRAVELKTLWNKLSNIRSTFGPELVPARPPNSTKVVISDQARVIGSQQLTGSPGPNPSSLKALLTFVHNGGPLAAATPFHLTYNANGLVVRVQEQYVP